MYIRFVFGLAVYFADRKPQGRDKSMRPYRLSMWLSIRP